MIPAFDSNGFLPAGEHRADWAEITTRFGINAHRLRLLAGFLEAATALHLAGSQWILINGSFVTNKPLPNDIDACYDDQNLDFDLLEQLEPSLLEFDNARASQKARFGCEFFPARAIADQAGRSFLNFFQTDRFGHPKGIVHFELRDLPKRGTI